jgi:hypothetical protein
VISFAADENLNDRIVRGLLRRRPDFDIVRIRDTEMRGPGILPSWNGPLPRARPRHKVVVSEYGG